MRDFVHAFKIELSCKADIANAQAKRILANSNQIYLPNILLIQDKAMSIHLVAFVVVAKINKLKWTLGAHKLPFAFTY